MIKFFDLQKLNLVSNKQSSFRFDISFLRIIAVFAVVFYHYNIFPFRSGFAGVDVFFVISGYLMTRIILSGFDKNTFNLIEFYKRRVVRIFPALLVLLILFSFIVFFFVPVQFSQYLRSAYSSSLFFSNIVYYLNNGYFSPSSHNNFLLHTWSLSVEWQFYMVFPVVLIFLRKVYQINLNLFIRIFLFLIMLSFWSMIFHSLKDINFSFYIFYTRAWEMLCGGLAFLLSTNIAILKRNIKIALAIGCYFVLGVCVVFFGLQEWPSVITIVPVIATTLIIALNVDFPILKNGFFKYLGDVSYSFYLYHWPIYVLSMFFGLNYSIPNRLFFIVLSLVFAILSFEFVEKRVFFKNVKLVLATSIVLFIITLSLNKMNRNLFPREFRNLMSVSYDYVKKEGKRQYNIGSKHFAGNKPFTDFDLKFIKFADNGKKNVILLGDSHAGMFAQTFENLDKKNINIIQISADATYPMFNSKSDLKESVNYFNYVFSSFFKLNKDKIDLVVISSNYATYDDVELEKRINFTNHYFESLKIKYIYLGQTQTYPIEFPTYIYMKKRYNILYPSENKIFEKNAMTNDYLKLKLGKKYINIFNYKIEKLSQNGYPYIYDNNHLTIYGTEQYRNFIFENINYILHFQEGNGDKK